METRRRTMDTDENGAERIQICVIRGNNLVSFKADASDFLLHDESDGLNGKVKNNISLSLEITPISQWLSDFSRYLALQLDAHGEARVSNKSSLCDWYVHKTDDIIQALFLFVLISLCLYFKTHVCSRPSHEISRDTPAACINTSSWSH